MKIETLQVQNFKNYYEEKFWFGDRFNCIVGSNGMGKTNVLDAIHYLAFTKSGFQNRDLGNIYHGRDFFVINGKFKEKKHFEVSCYFDPQKKKIFKLDRKEIEKVSSHIGNIPLITTSPYDSSIIQQGSEVRRKLVDGTISQHNSQFLKSLLSYQHILRQRNALIKSKNHLKASDVSLLDIYDNDAIKLSMEVSKERNRFINDIAPLFKKNHDILSDKKDKMTLHHVTNVLENNFSEMFKSSRKKDLLTQRTNNGCHKDEFDFRLGDYQLKKIGSQGQQKTFILAFRLSQYDLLRTKTKTKPIILLDDIFDKLDENRIELLINLLSDQERFGQVVLSDANFKRVSLHFSHRTDSNIFEINNGRLVRT